MVRGKHERVSLEHLCVRDVASFSAALERCRWTYAPFGARQWPPPAAHGARAHTRRSDNRCGIDGTLHRISRMMRGDDAYAYSYRIGRHVCAFDVAEPLYDVLCLISRALRAGRPPPSLLLLGAPGVGKTTMLRAITRYLATALSLR